MSIIFKSRKVDCFTILVVYRMDNICKQILNEPIMEGIDQGKGYADGYVDDRLSYDGIVRMFEH